MSQGPKVTPPRPVVALIPAAILVLAALNLAVPYFAIAPGPARDVKPLIVLTGAKTYPANGKLLLTTVSLRTVRVADAILGWLDPVVDVIPRDAIVPRGATEREVDKVNLDQMEESKRAAAAAALALLGYPLRVTGAGARVEKVLKGSPADGVLRAGDVIVAVDRRPVRESSELVAQVRRHRIGEAVALRVLREGKQQDLKVRTARSTEDPSSPVIGVQIATDSGSIELPFKVDIRSEGIGGPSAGLMFSLGIVDILQDGDLTKGLSVAGTGVISVDGKVSPVGGVHQKVAAAERAGAEVFLVPRDELRAARRAARSVRVVGVRDLGEAVRALGELRRPVQASG